MFKTNVFLIETPLQLLNAIEAKEYFKDMKSLLIVKYSGNAKNDLQIDQLLKLSQWDKIIYIRSNISKMITNFKALLFLRYLKKLSHQYEYIFIGEFQSHTFQSFCKNLEVKKCFILDDGVYTINLQKNILSKDKHIHEKEDALAIVKTAIKKILGLNDNKNITMHLFTCFDLEPHNKQLIIPNNYYFVKKMVLNEIKIIESVYFYNSAISEQGIMRLEDELLMLEKVDAYYKEMGKQITYIPHRFDSTVKLNKIQKMNIPIKKLEYLAEIEPLFNGELAGEMASFFSTTLYTLPKIYNFNRVQAFKIPRHYILEDKQNSLEELYTDIGKNIEIVNL